MADTRNDKLKSERAAVIVKRNELLQQMHEQLSLQRKLHDKGKWNDEAAFNSILAAYEQLPPALPDNKFDTMFIEVFNRRFNSLYNLASGEVGNNAIARKNAIDVINWNKTNKAIDLSKGKPDQQSEEVLKAFILANPTLNFIEKNKVYLHEGRNIRFEQNLTTNPTEQGDRKFYVISKEEADSFGKGADSRLRKVTASIEMKSGGIQWQPETELGVRITNTQYAQNRNINEGVTYSHDRALESSKKAEPFTHYGLQQPLEVIKKDKLIKNEEGEFVSSGDFSKSYALVNLLPGKDFDKACKIWLQTPRTTKEVIDFIILPLLEAYQKQIPPDFSHSDIKPGNVLIQIGKEGEPSIVNFIDFDDRQKIGAPTHTKGTPGYIPPEVFEPDTKVEQSRDVFALGVLITAAINKDLEPQALLSTYYDCDTSNVMDIFKDLLHLSSEQDYDAKAVLENSNDKFEEKREEMDERIADAEVEIEFFQDFLQKDIQALSATNLSASTRTFYEDRIKTTKGEIAEYQSALTSLQNTKASLPEKYTDEELASNLFRYVNGDKKPVPEKQREEVRILCKEMSSVDTPKRLEISENIQRFKAISQELAVLEHKKEHELKGKTVLSEGSMFHHQPPHIVEKPTLSTENSQKKEKR